MGPIRIKASRRVIVTAIVAAVILGTVTAVAMALPRIRASAVPSTGLPSPGGGWTWQNPLPAGNGLTAAAVYGGRFWVAGDTKGVYRTFDDGSHWYATDLPVNQSVPAVRFLSKDDGYVLTNNLEGQTGSCQLWSTDNGGVTYTAPVTIDGLPAGTVLEVHSADQIWVGGGLGYVGYTEDGGETMKVISISATTTVGPIKRLAFSDSGERGYALTQGILYRTEDSGESWTPARTTGSMEDMGVAFGPDASRDTVCVVGKAGLVALSRDGGDEWDELDVGTDKTLWGVQLPWARVIVVCGQGGTVYRSDDAGASWARASLPTEANLYALTADPETGVLAVCGQDGFLAKSGDFGATWSPMRSGFETGLNAIEVRDPETAWAVGGGGTILRTTDGRTWTAASSVPTSLELWGVTFTSYYDGWAVGDAGTVLGSTDGGRTWRRSGVRTQRGLRSVSFPDPRNGWAVGQNGLVVRTTNGGARWTAVSVPGSGDLLGVCFIDADHGWIVGASGRVLRTADGGRSWTRTQLGSALQLKAVQFVDKSYGWICGQGGGPGGNIGFHSTDGGVTWVRELIPGDASDDLYFVDRYNGWRVGMLGHVIRTTDGGLHWTFLDDTAPGQFMRGVGMTDLRNGFTVGTNGAILKTTTGGAAPED